jgi:hypothetical protein
VLRLTPLADPGGGEEPGTAGCAGRLTKPMRRPALVLALAGGGAADAQPAAGEPQRLRGRVLLAEDSEVNQLVTVAMVEGLGCEVEVAGDGREALAALERGHHDLVLMDCQMPQMDGFDATAELRRRGGHGATVPVIALTANVLAGDRERCLAVGMDGYLAKPFSQADLARTLARWLPAALPAGTAGPHAGRAAGRLAAGG